MKISELIDKLTAIKEHYGGMTVYCWPYDGQGRPFDINPEFELTKTEDGLARYIEAI